MSTSTSGADAAAAEAFPATRWSLVAAAGGSVTAEAGAALAAVCDAYWYPLYAYVRRSGRSPEDAKDITQTFFLHLLEKHWIAAADREKGRLRSFLITALKRFMAKEWRKESAAKRGGGVLHVPVDTGIGENRFITGETGREASDRAFDREWAVALLELTLRGIEAEYAEAGKGSTFAILKPCLTVSHGGLDYREMAGQLGVNEGAARVAVHRLHKRFRELYRDEVAETLPPGADLGDEMAYLADCLVGG